MQQEYTVYYIFNILKAAGSYLTADFLNLTDDSNRRKVFLKENMLQGAHKKTFFPNSLQSFPHEEICKRSEKSLLLAGHFLFNQ